jgi:hypothetical protein
LFGNQFEEFPPGSRRKETTTNSSKECCGGGREIAQIFLKRGGRESQFWDCEKARGSDKGGDNGTRLKQVWVIAALPQLHNNVQDGEHVPRLEVFPSGPLQHEFAVQETLPLGKRA